jgi:hypothetical protein
MKETPPMTDIARTVTALAVATLLLTTSAADAALTTGKCLVLKRQTWSNLRKCEATEQVKQLKGKPADLATCQTKFQEKLAKITDQATKAAIACRFRDNGDSSVTDFDTGLMWAKNNDVTVNYKAPWSEVMSTFVSACNGSSTDGASLGPSCSIYHDWRVPNILELKTILDLGAAGCGSGSPCIDPIFGPTVAGFYWSATTDATFPLGAWGGDFLNSGVGFVNKGGSFYVRAVRTGL